MEIVNGISFIEPCLALLGIDALDGLQILDALEIAAQYHPPLNPAKPALLAQVYSQSVASNLKLALMNQYPDTTAIKLIHGAGRDVPTLRRAGEAVFAALNDHMAGLLARRPVALSFEIAEIHPDLNFKAGTIRDHMKARAETAEAAE